MHYKVGLSDINLFIENESSDCMFSSCHVRVSEWIHTLQLPECQELLARNRRESVECGFTWHDKTCSQMHRTDKYSQHTSVIWPVWLNGWVFVHELSGCGFESSCNESSVWLSDQRDVTETLAMKSLKFGFHYRLTRLNKS